MARKILWFAIYWLAGLAAVSLLAYGIRLVIL